MPPNSRRERLARLRAKKNGEPDSAPKIDDRPPVPDGEHPTETARKATRRASSARKRPAKKTGEKSAASKRPTDFVGLPSDEARRGQHLLTPELSEVIQRLCRNSLFQYNAAQLAGVSPKTFEGWMRRGRIRNAEIEEWHHQAGVMADDGISEPEILRELGPVPERDRYAEFEAGINVSEAESESSIIGTIVEKALDGDEKCAQWYLERAKPKRYGKAVVSGKIMEGSTGTDGVAGDPLEELLGMLAGFTDRANADIDVDDDGGE